MFKKKSGFLAPKLNQIIELARTGGKGKVRFQPLKVDKVTIENSGPPDKPTALAYVTNESDDIHFVLPNLEKAIREEAQKKGMNPSDLDSIDLSNLENNPKLDLIILVLQSAMQVLGHELGHQQDYKATGKLRDEAYAESEGKKIMDTFKVSNKRSKEKDELNKLASKLQVMGEDSFAKDVIRISSMVVEPVQEQPKALSSNQLDLLVKDLEKKFSV
jgi:hypothetical protein